MMNKRTLEKHHRYILPTIENILSGKETILDVGCGNGAIANYLLDKGYNVYGVDRHPGRIATAGQKHPKRFCVLDMETASSLPEELSDIGFDTIISTEVIEHLYSPRKFLSFCLNTLKGGKTDYLYPIQRLFEISNHITIRLYGQAFGTLGRWRTY